MVKPWGLCLSAPALLLMLAACGPQPTASHSPTSSPSPGPSIAATAGPQLVKPPHTLVTSGTLTFLSDTSYPPQESIDPQTNRAVGFDIDIANAIAARMGLTATIVTTDYAIIVPSLLARKGDAVISAMAVTPELERQVAFVGYFQSGESIMVRKGNPAGIQKLSDLCGRKVGVQVTTAEQDTLTSENSGDCAQRHLEINTYPTDTAAVQVLRDGGLDAVIDDAPVSASFVAGNPDTLEIAGAPFHLGTEGIAVDPQNHDLLTAIQQAMLSIYEDGTYRDILARWHLESEELPASQIIVSPAPQLSPSG
ncbi:MAG TPA: ABC transporter substrate-binding protein [Candidatus Limnocylindrales bacterium]|nr:ABC transporter substrate-binding protein [Candidatus Limnocylindrales bacterium]